VYKIKRTLKTNLKKQQNKTKQTKREKNEESIAYHCLSEL
jgi:hypothetical protein